jgi:hypothetical protein
VTRFGPPPNLGLNREAVLAEHARQMASIGFPLTKDALAHKAKELAAKDENEKDVGGHTWVDNFLKRHPDLKVKRSEPLEVPRLNSVSRESVQRHFDLLKEVVDGVKPEDIYMMDETHVTLGSSNVPVSTKFSILSYMCIGDVHQ